ncbi:HD domain-containing phosphohydrolase [Janthinobacterium sp. PC23-8]|uniref:HD domain-containing phosphohydrolase n=1 Tax=Janthinobacterium sp. PC23-8 TaxID=2012679 RepID=UPI000B973D40|nr:HD domain-containing phosphohydrolase [Janthinobacterium sp. PC23-8]OYO28669.1 two-component system response regulator [Janthinobacterium sp. PC23-8]
MDVLLLDDDQMNLKLFSRLLDGMPGVTTVALSMPLQALEYCRERRPDLVLIDYMMPEMDGLAFLQALRALYPGDPVAVIMITAAIDKDIRYRALQLGANDFLTKPIDNIEFRARVGNLLTLRRAQRELSLRAESLALAVAAATRAIAAGELDAIHRLSRMAEYRDPETGSHLLRMASYAKVLAASLGLDHAQQELIYAAAPMHDIGKIGIADHILLKPGRLDGDEMAIMRTHPKIGAAILHGSASPLLQAAEVIALHHHERYDGSGYPSGLAGEAIPLFGRIIAVADVFDALTSVRPYKRAWECGAAFDFLEEGAGSHFDPACVQAFLRQREVVLAIHDTHRDPPC